jgi:hypothetical protein
MGGEVSTCEEEGCQELAGDVFRFSEGGVVLHDDAKRFTVLGVFSND